MTQNDEMSDFERELLTPDPSSRERDRVGFFSPPTQPTQAQQPAAPFVSPFVFKTDTPPNPPSQQPTGPQPAQSWQPEPHVVSHNAALTSKRMAVGNARWALWQTPEVQAWAGHVVARFPDITLKHLADSFCKTSAVTGELDHDGTPDGILAHYRREHPVQGEWLAFYAKRDVEEGRKAEKQHKKETQAQLDAQFKLEWAAYLQACAERKQRISNAQTLYRQEMSKLEQAYKTALMEPPPVAPQKPKLQ
jgi:hypothetical protein